MKGQNKGHDSSNCTNLAFYLVTSPEVFRTRYSVSELVLGKQRWHSGRQCDAVMYLKQTSSFVVLYLFVGAFIAS